MAIFDPTITKEVSDRAVQNTLRGFGRKIPDTIPEIEAIKQKKVHIFNVGPWSQVVNTGSTGSFTIPACPIDKHYVELLISDGKGGMVPPISVIMDELYPLEGEYKRLSQRGLDFAQSMLGIGRGQIPDHALTHFGIFCTEGEKPTERELSDAHGLLENRCKRIYKEAVDVYSTDRKLFSQIVKPSIHFVAAKVLGLDNAVDSPWMIAAAPAGRVKCKMCGRVVDPDVAVCEAGHIVNAELYQTAMAEQRKMQQREAK